MSENKSVTGAAVGAERTKAVADLIAKMKASNAEVRTKAWLGAGEVGWPAVTPLAEVMTDANLEVARAAKRALWKIVRHAGRPGADQERQSVAVHVSSLLAGDKPVAVRREALWMLSEIGEKGLIKPIAGLLKNNELREDARMVLERIGDKGSLAALKDGFETAPEEFKPNIAQSLRKHGKKVRGYECVKLVPTKQTAVKALPK